MEKSFHEIELQAWSERAEYYDRLFASISSQAIDPILDSLGALDGRMHLDVACGTGHLVAAAARRGAISEGIDFAQPMVDVAAASYPQSRFRVGDARHLPQPAASVDAVTCAFGLSHMDNPQAAINEAYRVLKPGGRFAFALWFGPENGGEMMSIVNTALQSFASVPFDLPQEWTLLRIADPHTCEALTKLAGFGPPSFTRLEINWQSTSAQTMLEIYKKISVRTRMVIDFQPPAVQRRIDEYILTAAEARRSNNGLITFAWPALLTVVQKPV